MKAVKTALTSMIPTGLPLPILTGPLRTRWWITGAAAGVGKGLSVLVNRSEPQQLSIARATVQAKEECICFDIGANVGFYTLLFSMHCKHVFAFEPLPRNVGYLVRMCRLNRLENVTVLPFAVSDRAEFLSFQEGENCALGRLDAGGNQPVSTISCDEFISRYGVTPSVLKVDVEGAELSVLKGASRLLSEKKPTVFLSTHGKSQRSDCLALLSEFGYTRIVPLNSRNIDQSTEFLVGIEGQT